MEGSLRDDYHVPIACDDSRKGFRDGRLRQIVLAPQLQLPGIPVKAGLRS